MFDQTSACHHILQLTNERPLFDAFLRGQDYNLPNLCNMPIDTNYTYTCHTYTTYNACTVSMPCKLKHIHKNDWDPFRYAYIVWTNIYLLYACKLYTQYVNNIYALYIKQTCSTNISIQIQIKPTNIIRRHCPFCLMIVMHKFWQHPGPTFKFFSLRDDQAANRKGSFWQIGRFGELRRNKILLIGTIPTVLPLR